jgi:hypothetical protein
LRFQSGRRRNRPPAARPLTRVRAGDRLHGGFIFHGSPARCEQAGDGRGRRNRIPRLLAATRFPAGASRPAGSSSMSRRRSNRN